MTKLKLSAIPDDKSEKLTVELTTLWIVEAFDAVEYNRLGIAVRPKDLPYCLLCFQLGKEALHCGILAHVAGSVHRAGDALCYLLFPAFKSKSNRNSTYPCCENFLNHLW